MEALRPATPTVFGSIPAKSPRGLSGSTLMPIGGHRAARGESQPETAFDSGEKPNDLSVSQRSSLIAAEAEDELLVFDARSNRVYSAVRSKGVMVGGALLALSWVLGVGFFPSLLVLAILVILAARVFPLGLDNDATIVAEQLDNVSMEMIQFFLWGLNSVSRNYLHAAVYLLDVDRAIAISLISLLVVHL